MHKSFVIIIAVPVLLAFCGCGGGGGGGKSKAAPDTTAPDIHIDAIGMQGALDESATVTVNSVTDQDGLNDAGFSVLLPMGTHGLPADPATGSSAMGTLQMQATDASTNVGGQDLDLTIHH